MIFYFAVDTAHEKITFINVTFELRILATTSALEIVDGSFGFNNKQIRAFLTQSKLENMFGTCRMSYYLAVVPF